MFRANDAPLGNSGAGPGADSCREQPVSPPARNIRGGGTGGRLHVKRSNSKRSRRTDRPTLPELDQVKRSVLNSLASLQSRRSYQHANPSSAKWGSGMRERVYCLEALRPATWSSMTSVVVTGSRSSKRSNTICIPAPTNPGSKSPELRSEPRRCTTTGVGHQSGCPEIRTSSPPKYSAE